MCENSEQRSGFDCLCQKDPEGWAYRSREDSSSDLITIRPSIFERQIEFIQQSGIIMAMVGLLNAPRGTRLYQRIVKENRLVKDSSGDNTDFSTNFIPTMGYDALVKGYKRIISGIYAPQPYYERVKNTYKTITPWKKPRFTFISGTFGSISAMSERCLNPSSCWEFKIRSGVISGSCFSGRYGGVPDCSRWP